MDNLLTSSQVGATSYGVCACQRERQVWEKGRSQLTSDAGDVDATHTTNKRASVPVVAMAAPQKLGSFDGASAIGQCGRRSESTLRNP